MSTLEDFDRILAELAPPTTKPAASAEPVSAPAPAASAPKAAVAPPTGPAANKTVAPPRPSVVATPPRQASNPDMAPSNADKIAELESMLLDLGPSPKASPVVPRAGPSANAASPGTPKVSNNTSTPAGGAAKIPTGTPRRNASFSVSKTAPTVSSDIVVCGRCEKQITGTYISALDKNWHPEHFTCHSCNKSLNGNFFDTDKGILCTDCASEQIKCAECGKPITGTHLIYGDGRPVHNECVPKSKCGRCNNFLSLGDAHVEALDQLWHPECFACTRCMTPLGATFVQFEGTPYCQACIQILSKERNIVFKT